MYVYIYILYIYIYIYKEQIQIERSTASYFSGFSNQLDSQIFKTKVKGDNAENKRH